jgi:exopolysaccharide biosynthesis polyprenyl glycosylphosphotransferase
MQEKKIIKIYLLLGDILITQVALFLTLLIRNRHLVPQFNGFSYNFFVVYIAWIVILFVLNLYDIYFFKKPIDFFLNLTIFSLGAIFAGITYFYFRPEFGITPKTILVLNVLVFDILFWAWRYLFTLLLQVRGLKEKVVIIGFQKDVKETMAHLNKNYEVVGFFCPSFLGNNIMKSALPGNQETIHSIQDLKKVVLEKKVTSVIFALDFYSHKDLVQQVFYNLPLTLNYVTFTTLYEFMNKKVSLDQLDEIWFLQKISKSENKLEKSVKRCFDIVFSLIGLLVFIILYPVIALLIKSDSQGRILYTQKRVGKNGSIFTIRKFRTMKEDWQENKKVWREKDKDAITKVGRVLRRLHLDELPQAWNILKGDLSFVGPRPEWTELATMFEKEIPYYKQRYLVKPGIVGWAQINFPASHSLEEVKEKFQYDLYYIKNHSLLLDLEIILKAIKLFFW